jgi:hypothetical protein
MADNSLGVGNTEIWAKRFGLAIPQLASRVRGRGGSEAYAPLRVKLPGSGREVVIEEGIVASKSPH